MTELPSGLPQVKKWLLCIDLKIGVLIWSCFEIGIWAILSYAALDNESAFFSNWDLYKYEEHIEDNWYYQMIFGTPEEEDYDYEMGYESTLDDTDGIDEEFRYENMAVNGLLMLVFIAYFLLEIIFILGIAKKATNFLIPFIVYDSYIIWMSFIMIFAGLFLMNFVLVRNCTIFVSVKFYPAVCNYSLFKKMKGKFSFTREVPQILRSSPRTFERKSASVSDEIEVKVVKNNRKNRKNKNIEDVHEMQSLRNFEDGVRRNNEVKEIIVKR